MRQLCNNIFGLLFVSTFFFFFTCIRWCIDVSSGFPCVMMLLLVMETASEATVFQLVTLMSEITASPFVKLVV